MQVRIPLPAITFEALGDCMDITPTDYARRYVPESWSVNPQGTWARDSESFKATFVLSNPGDYTLSVVFRQQMYLNGKWCDTDTVSETEVAFVVKEAEAQPLPTPTSAPDATPDAIPAPDSSKAEVGIPEQTMVPGETVAKSPATGEDNSLTIMFAFASLGILLIICGKKRIGIVYNREK